MMFKNLSDRLEPILKKLKGRGKLNEENIRESLREIRIALLEADVNFKIVKGFIARIADKAVGSEVMESLTPGHQVVKIVHEELIHLLGSESSQITFSRQPPTIILMVGLQGSGKTTSAAKLAKKLKDEGEKPFLVPADVYRPAAIEQLNILGEKLDAEVFATNEQKDPVKICRNACAEAIEKGLNPIIIDTAGRLHVDEKLMKELKNIKVEIEPHEILLVADAMTGQEAVNIAQSFDNSLGIDGIILTKMDGDARGGAALSIREITGKPIKFIGVGEKLEALEAFHPDRLASRILGMGDVLSLIEKAKSTVSNDSAEDLYKKIKKDTFSLEDFKNQLAQIKKMGPLDKLMGMLPGMKGLKNIKIDDKAIVRTEAIINSMTSKERLKHQIINGNRKKRIAKGSGTHVSDVNRLLKQFVQSKKMMNKFSKMNLKNGLGMQR
ncbi:MAG TPA: signal recognition particle protein [Nitrospinota bacterium]|nr:signal recognition particle protein [Nitrospinota bacterium]HJN02387.1 signal recognition particle protein [Nitrospinota bacterium]